MQHNISSIGNLQNSDHERLTSLLKITVYQGSHYTSYRKNKGLRQSMSHRGNCWDNALQESFFGHMKDHIKLKLNSCTEFGQVKALIDDYIDYYNKERYQWQLAKLSPDEFYQFITTGIYPLPIKNAPSVEIYLHADTSKDIN